MKNNREHEHKLCNECDRKFPAHLIQPLVSNTYTILLCPLCALRIRNVAHGLPIDTPFNGEMANQLWQEANKWING